MQAEGFYSLGIRMRRVLRAGLRAGTQAPREASQVHEERSWILCYIAYIKSPSELVQ